MQNCDTKPPGGVQRVKTDTLRIGHMIHEFMVGRIIAQNVCRNH